MSVIISQQSLKEVPRKGFQRVKRERPTDLDVSRSSNSNSSCAGSVTPSGGAHQGPDIKRMRNTPVEYGRSLADAMKSPVTVLDDCLGHIKRGDCKAAIKSLCEFSSEHIATLPEALHVQCAKVLLTIATEEKLRELSPFCLRNIHTVFHSSNSKPELWNTIGPLLIEKDISDMGVNELELLSLFKVASLNELLNSEQCAVAMRLARVCLHSADYLRRIASIHFLSAKIMKSHFRGGSGEFPWFEKLLCDVSGDRDGRVRVAAVIQLSELARSGRTPLSFELYPVVKKLCVNTEKSVRIQALHILHHFADRYPESEVTGSNDSKLRLIDDAFTVVCHAVNDLEMSVRAEAVALLGRFEGVSDSFLDQTLDKKLLNAMRMSKTKDSASRRPPQYYRSRRDPRGSSSKGGWSTGKKLGEDVPVERTDDENTSIIPTGVCGAFVTALEDEFMVVRQAGVYSLGRLAARRPFLAAAALDHLADMFNDEIEQVRLDAIHALTPLVVHGVLHKEQLDTILTVLDDASPDSREALRVLLGKATLGTSDCVRQSVNALDNCLKRFPVDRQSIFSCVSNIGRRHGAYLQPLVYELLNLNPPFDSAEPMLENAFYLVKIILILNAASVHSPICSLLPSFAVRHYRYLRCSMPHLVPFISTFADKESSNVGVTLNVAGKEATGGHTRSLLEKFYKQIQIASETESSNQRTRLQKFLLRDMEGLCEVDESAAGTAQLLVNLHRAFARCELSTQMLLFGGDSLSAIAVIEQGVCFLDRAQFTFGNVDAVMLGLLEECRFRMRLLALIARIDTSSVDILNAISVLNAEVALLQQHLEELGVQPSASMVVLLSGLAEKFVGYGERKKVFVAGAIVEMLQLRAFVLPKKFSSLGDICIKWAQIIEPCEVPSEPLRFIAGLPMGIPFNIILYNFSDTDTGRFRVKVDYPDQKSTLFRPRRTDFKQITTGKCRLVCSVIVEASAWSEAASVHIGCVLQTPSTSSADCSDAAGGEARCRCVEVFDSPYSNKQAAIDMPIYPMTRLGC